MHFPDHRPKNSPPNKLRITKSDGANRGNFRGPDFLSLKGYRLRDALAEIYGTTSRRIHLPTELSGGPRYDFEIVSSQPESREEIHDRAKRGINEHFALDAGYQTSLVDTYVVMAAENRLPKKAFDPEQHGSCTTSSVEYCMPSPTEESGELEPWEIPDGVDIAMITGASAEGTVDEFCRTLEMTIDRPVVNETGIEGEFEFRAPSSPIIEDFRQNLRRHLGLIIEASQRHLEILVLRPTDRSKIPNVA